MAMTTIASLKISVNHVSLRLGLPGARTGLLPNMRPS